MHGQSQEALDRGHALGLQPLLLRLDQISEIAREAFARARRLAPGGVERRIAQGDRDIAHTRVYVHPWVRVKRALARPCASSQAAVPCPLRP